MTKSRMTSKQRMLSAMKLEGPDYLPFSPCIAQGPWYDEPFFWTDQIKRARKLLTLGLDPTIDIWLPDPQPSPDVRIKTRRDKRAHETLITKEYHTPAGVLRQVVRETDDWCNARHGPWVPTTWGIEKLNSYSMALFDDYNVSRRVEPWVKGPDDLEKLRYIIRLPEGHILDEWRMDTQRALEQAENMGLATVVRRTIVGDAFQWFCDIPWFLMQLYDDPTFVSEFFGIFKEWAKSQAMLAIEFDVDVFQYRGWYEVPAYFGPNFWKKYIGPAIEEQAALIHSAGKSFSYLLPEGQGAYSKLMKGSSADVLQGVDPRMLHGGNLADLFNTCGKTKAFWGGVNAEVTLQSGDYDQIEAEVKSTIEALGSNGGLILSSFLFPEVPSDGILYMIRAWKKYRDFKVV